MSDWIAPGGQLVIQNDPHAGQRQVIIDKHGFLIRRLISEGWDFRFGFAGRDGHFSNYALDTMILTRPMLPSKIEANEMARMWSDYQESVQRVDVEPRSFSAGFDFSAFLRSL